MTSQFKLSVCPHDTAKNLVGWYTLNTYLQRRLEVGMSFDPQENFLVERQKVLESDYHLVYANPYSVLSFAKEKGFIPVARPAGVLDEAVVVAKAESASIPDSPRVASATDKLIIHSLGLQVMKASGMDPAHAHFSFVGNHINAAKAVLQDQADLGFVFNETWNGMAQTTRAGLRVVGESNGGQAFHCFMVGPGWADRAQAVQDILCSMHEDEAGRRVLKDLQFTAFEPVGGEVIAPLAALIGL